MSEEKFERFYHDEWMEHVRSSGGIVAQIKLLTWLVGTLLTSQIVVIGFLITVLTRD